MKQIICLILVSILIISFNCKLKFKTIDCESFEIKVPQNWNKFKMKGIDSYEGVLERSN